MNTAALARYFLKLGTIGFGGPIALAGYMQRDLVEERGWFTEEEYGEGLALAQLAPGPLAAQLAIYLGWLRGGFTGATVVAVAFVAPSFVMVLALSAVYLAFGSLPWMRGAFYGIGAAVIAIIARSAWKLTAMVLRRDRLRWAIWAVNAMAVVLTGAELLSVLIASGVVMMLARDRRAASAARSLVLLPPWLVSGENGPASTETLGRILLFFTKAGAVVFGSGLAIVPFLHGGVVKEYAWLADRQFLDAVAVSMITPGPVVITVAFIGYLTAGPLGAHLAAIGVFLPAYLTVVIAAPHFRRIAGNTRVAGFVDGATAAATGAIAGACVVLGQRAIVDLPTAAIGAGVLLALLATRRVPEPVLIVVAGLVGVALGG